MQDSARQHSVRLAGAEHAAAATHMSILSQAATGLPPLQVAGRTNDSAGDGTTTASVLAREIIHYGLQVGSWFSICLESISSSDVRRTFRCVQA
jgi:hypothetical protein